MSLQRYDTSDFLVTGIVASKSPVRQVRGKDDGGNYLVIKITDLKVPHCCFEGVSNDSLI